MAYRWHINVVGQDGFIVDSFDATSADYPPTEMDGVPWPEWIEALRERHHHLYGYTFDREHFRIIFSKGEIA